MCNLDCIQIWILSVFTKWLGLKVVWNFDMFKFIIFVEAVYIYFEGQILKGALRPRICPPIIMMWLCGGIEMLKMSTFWSCADLKIVEAVFRKVRKFFGKKKTRGNVVNFNSWKCPHFQVVVVAESGDLEVIWHYENIDTCNLSWNGEIWLLFS